MNERVWPSLLGGKLTIFKIPFKKTLLATLIVTDHPKNFIDISLLVWVNTSSRMVWLTKIKEFSILVYIVKYETVYR